MFKRKKRFVRKFYKKRRAVKRMRRRRRNLDVCFATFQNTARVDVNNQSVTYRNLNVRIGDFGDAADYLQLYEQYRINKVVCRIRPRITAVGNTSGSSGTTNSTQVGDHALVRAPSTITLAQNDRTWNNFVNVNRCKIRRGTQELKAVCVPNTLGRVATLKGQSLTPQSGYGETQYKKWNGSGEDDIVYFTWQYMHDWDSSLSTSVDIYIKVYCQFKTRLNVLFNSS